MHVAPKYHCSDTYQGKPGQATEIVRMIVAHEDETACIEWPHKLRKLGGYGVVRHAGTDWRVHRLAYKIAHGSVPDDKVVMHSCDNPACFNPKHLSLGTRTENAADRHQKGRTKPPINPTRGATQWKAKLTELDVQEILRMYRDGSTQVSIGQRFQVSQAQVSTITRGISWKHVGRA